MTRLKTCKPTSLDPNAVLKVKIPGNSPAYHVGDPHDDLLHIKSLDWLPNPIIMSVKPFDSPDKFARDQDIQLKLRGVLLKDIGPHPKVCLSVKQNGTPYASMNPPLHDTGHRLEV